MRDRFCSLAIYRIIIFTRLPVIAEMVNEQQITHFHFSIIELDELAPKEVDNKTDYGH